MNDLSKSELSNMEKPRKLFGWRSAIFITLMGSMVGGAVIYSNMSGKASDKGDATEGVAHISKLKKRSVNGYRKVKSNRPNLASPSIPKEAPSQIDISARDREVIVSLFSGDQETPEEISRVIIDQIGDELLPKYKDMILRHVEDGFIHLITIGEMHTISNNGEVLSVSKAIQLAKDDVTEDGKKIVSFADFVVEFK